MKHNFAEFLKSRRLKLGLSQNDIAKELNFTNGQYISNMERGECLLPKMYIKKLSEILKVKPSLIIEPLIKDIRQIYYELVDG